VEVASELRRLNEKILHQVCAISGKLSQGQEPTAKELDALKSDLEILAVLSSAFGSSPDMLKLSERWEALAKVCDLAARPSPADPVDDVLETELADAPGDPAGDASAGERAAADSHADADSSDGLSEALLTKLRHLRRELVEESGALSDTSLESRKRSLNLLRLRSRLEDLAVIASEYRSNPAMAELSMSLSTLDNHMNRDKSSRAVKYCQRILSLGVWQLTDR